MIKWTLFLGHGCIEMIPYTGGPAPASEIQMVTLWIACDFTSVTPLYSSLVPGDSPGWGPYLCELSITSPF